jgi:transposase
LEQALLAAGERVVRVPPHRMGVSRRGEREPGKSDEIDALAIARAVVGDGVDSFAVAYLDEQAMEIRLLLDHRRQLVAERSRTIQPAAVASPRAAPRARGLSQAGGV